jgi:S-adenosylmethionine hydrolase
VQESPLVTLTTDFGTADGYVAAMKGVILGIAPGARLVDVSHEVAPQDVRQAAYVLYSVYAFFSPHTVHLVVIDPGVGSERRPVALRTPAGIFVGPDNGVLSYVMAREPVEAVVELADARYRLPRASDTFHGRDVFAPAAAHLANGVPISALGPSVSDPVTIPMPRLDVASAAIKGEVLHVDRFGNAITSIGRLAWVGNELVLDPAFGEAKGGSRVRFRAATGVVRAAGKELAGVRHTYAEVEPGAALALVGSGGHLELAIRDGHAGRALGLSPGDEVVLSVGREQ